MVSTAAYMEYLKALSLGAGVNLSSAALHVVLLDDSYSPNLATDKFYDDLSGELPTADGYVAGGFAVDSQVVDAASSFAYLDGDDIVVPFDGFTGSFRWAVLVEWTGTPSTSHLIFLINFDSNQSPTNTVRLRWALPASGGVLKFARG